MKTFEYVAQDQSGKKLQGKKKANNSQEVADYLHEKGLMVVSVNENVGLDLSKIGDIQIGGIPLKEKILITKQLATMLKAGVAMIQALDVLVSQAENKALKEDLKKVYKSVEGGLPLSKAFEKNTKIFDDIQINLIEAGEKSGNLVVVMEQITIDMEKRNDLSGKIKGALIYPVIIFVVMAVVIVMMLVFMIPAVEKLYADFGVDSLPFVTQIFVDASAFFRSPVGVISSVIVLLAFIFGFRSYYASESGRKSIDKLQLRIPVFGKLFEYSQVVQFGRLLSMMIFSGLPIIEALNTTSKALNNIHFKEALSQAATDVSKGSPLAVSLSKSQVIPVMLIKMIAIGEDTGTLDKMLKDMSKFYEDELNNMTSNLTKLMEPFILVVVGVLVGLLAVAIYLPIYQITNI